MIYRLTLLAVTALLVSLSTIQGQSNRARAASTSTETAPQETPESPDSAALAGAIQEETERIDRTYVISATRHAQRIYDLPYTGSVVAGPELDRSRSLQDALRESPGVQLQRTSYGQTSPFLRGLTGYHTLMLIDGIRLNNSVLRSGPNEYWGLVDPLSLDRVEVVLGPSSVLYGSDAVGGSVNAVPVRRRDYKPGFHWDRRLYMRYSSAENSITSRAQISGNIGEDFGFVVGGDIASFDDLDGGRGVGRQDHTGYHTAFGDVALDFHLDENWHLGILGQIASLDNVGRTHRTVHAVSFHGTTGGSDRRRNFNWDRELVGVFLDGYDFEGFIDSMRLRLSWHHIGEERDRVRSDGRRDIRGFDVDTYGVALEFVSETTIGRLTYGIDWYHDQVASYRDNFDASGAFTGSSIQGPVGDDATYDLVGIFLQDEGNLHDDLDLILGGRFTYASADAGRVQDPNTGLRTSIDDDFVSAVGSVRVVWSALDELRLFGGVSQAFRAPNLSDLTRFDSARSNEIEIPSRVSTRRISSVSRSAARCNGKASRCKQPMPTPSSTT